MHARSAFARSARARADAFLRRGQARGAVEAPHAGLAALPVHRPQDHGHREHRRRDRGRGAGGHSGMASVGRSFSSASSTSIAPEKLWSAIIVTAALGIVFYAIVRIVELRRCADGPKASRDDRADRRPVVSLAGVGKTFARRVNHDRGPERDRPRDRQRRVRVVDRSIRLRQVDPAAHHRRPDPGILRRGAGQRKARRAGSPRSRLRDGLPGSAPVRLAHVEENVQLPLELLGQDRRNPRPTRSTEMLDARRSHRLRATSSVSAVGWHAAASGDRARPRLLADRCS